MAKSDQAGKSAKRLVGVLGEDTPKGFVRLCRPDDPEDFLEIEDSAVLSREKLTAPDGGKLIALMVDRDANIRRCSTVRISREAELLQGSLLAQFRDSNLAGASDRGRDILVQLYTAKTETTLTCWEDCTYYISSCLTSESA